MDLGLGVVGRHELGQWQSAGVEGDRVGLVVDDEAIVDVGLSGAQCEWDMAACGDFGSIEGGRAAGGDAAVVDGEVGVCGEGDDSSLDGWAAGEVEVAFAPYLLA